VDTLKIGRSFVDGVGRDEHDTAIVRSIIELGRTLGLTVTAEGVETPLQQSCLERLGCDRGQGYLLPSRSERMPWASCSPPRADGRAGLLPERHRSAA
jgi:EAL domain-containing protein (putative c-di-GMP-specific phosphodiesterase class I)